MNSPAFLQGLGTKRIVDKGKSMEINFSDRNKKYWDKRSTKYSALRQKELTGVDKEAWQSYLLSHLQGKKKVLDIGAGPGFLSILLAEKGYEVTALDASLSMLTEGKKNGEDWNVEIDWVLGDALQLPFEEESFDGIVTRNLTWNLPDVPKAYEEWRRVLKKEGILLNFDSDYGLINFIPTAKMQTNAHHGVEESLIEECETLKNELRITTHRRPFWDVERLYSIGFSKVELEEDIREKVHKDTTWDYDPLPLFCLIAKK